MFNLLKSASWHARQYLSVYISMFLTAHLGVWRRERREERGEKREESRLEECRQYADKQSQNRAVKEQVFSENQSVRT